MLKKHRKTRIIQGVSQDFNISGNMIKKCILQNQSNIIK